MTIQSSLSDIVKIRGFDLNLLLTFEAVYLHQSVTKAANLMDVSPSAVSQSLTKLRCFFSDPLFIREKNSLVATTIAENLHASLSQNFSHLLESLNSFSDVITKSRFIVHSTAYLATRLLPEICSAVEKDKFDCEILHISTDAMLDVVEDVLTYRKADIIFDSKPHYSLSTICESIATDSIVPVCRKDHPRLGSTLTKEEMQREKSTFLRVDADNIKQFQAEIQNRFEEREFSFISSSLIANASIVEKTDAFAFISKWFAEKFIDSFNIKILECDLELVPVTHFMIYNKTSLKNNNFTEFLKVIRKANYS